MKSCLRCLAVIAGSLAFLGWDCGGSDDPGPAPPHGPPGALLEFDAQAISLGDRDAGRSSGDASRVGAGGTGGGGHDDAGESGAGGSGGSGTPESRCTGIPLVCSPLGSIQCSSAPGCRDDPYCHGVSSSCYSQYNSYSCSSLRGCYWSTYSKSCSGSSWSCDLFSGSSSCIGQDGCSWRERCTGFATPCSLLSTTECTRQPGCHVENL